MTTPSPVARALARAFRPFAKVKPEESGAAALMTLTAFLLLTAYYLLKTVREPLILTQGGAEVKLYARAAQGVLMVGVVHVYGELARRVGRMKLLAIVFVFFLSNLIVFAVLAATPLRIGLAFFLWVGVFSYTVVAQFWALAADIFTEEQGKRLFPIIGGGSSVGAVAGARLAKSLVPFGPAALMGTSAVILVVCVSLILWIERRAGAEQAKAHDHHPDAPLSGESVFHLLGRDKYLLLIAFMVLLLNWVNSSGEYILDRTLLAAGREAHLEGTALQAFIGVFKADYFAWYNLIGVVLQLLAVSRILSRLGVRNALLFLPGFALVGYGAAAFAPVLSVLRLVKIGENSLQYSVADTARNALFLVTSRVEKYVGKTAIDTVAVRCGSIMSSVVVLIGTQLALPTAAFGAINVALTATWIAVVFAMRPEHARRSEEGEKELAAEPVPS